MLGWITGILRGRFTREHGQVLVLFAVGLAAFCGLTGMAVDIGQVVHAKADLQKQADAAALAGSQDLPSASIALQTANTYVTKNGGSSCQPNCASVNSANDTITVTTRRHINYTFLKVLGLSGIDLHATAAVRSILATGFAFNNPAVFPYAVWGGNQSYGNCQAPYGLCVGAQKTYRANNWDSQVSPHNNNPKWTVNGNNFKGYFNTSNQQQTVYQSDPNSQYSFGGNAIGQEPVDELHQHWLTHTPIVIPVIAKGSCSDQNCGTLNFTIVSWVALQLDQDPASTNGSWTGTIVNYTTSGGVGGGYNPGGGAAQVRTSTMIQ